MNKRGDVIAVYLIGALIVSMTSIGVYKTQKNGILQNNGKKIWCKMQNKGEDYCETKYPKPNVQWDFTAERCRDMKSGQFIDDAECN